MRHVDIANPWDAGILFLFGFMSGMAATVLLLAAAWWAGVM